MALEVGEDAASYALRLLCTAGFVTSRSDGRVVHCRLAAGSPEPLREHRLRGLVELSRRSDEDG